MYQILFILPDKQRVILDKVNPNQSILDIALGNNIEIEALCGGAGVCGECVVYIQKGMEFFQNNTNGHVDVHKRYACQSILLDAEGELIIKI